MDYVEYTEAINDLAENVSSRIVQAAILPSANELLADIKNRIVVDGKNSANRNIGSYSTKEAYFTKEQFDKKSSFRPAGKYSRSTTFENGKPRRSMYIKDGYKGLRGTQGKPTDNVRLDYTGSSMTAYINEPIENGVLQGLSTERASDIRNGQEAKRGERIYSPTPQEIERYNDNVVEDLTKLTIETIENVSK